MSVREALEAVLCSPTARDIWKLRALLLEAGLPARAPVWRLLDEFRQFLDRLATSSSSREYSELASKLDIGAVGGVVVQQLLEDQDHDELALKLLTGVLSEGLMVLASRQQVRAWDGELNAVYRGAGWYLYEELWHWAADRKPDLPPSERRLLLDRLIAPIHDDAISGFSKAALVGLLFQIVLLSRLSQETGIDA